MRFSELCEKEVVNMADCKCVGYVADMEFDECTGCVRGLIVPQPGHCWGVFGPSVEYCIPWNRVIRIGPDIVLVDVCLKDAVIKH